MQGYAGQIQVVNLVKVMVLLPGVRGPIEAQVKEEPNIKQGE